MKARALYITEVIVLSRSLREDTVSYLSGEKFTTRDVIEVPLRSRTIPAIVISSRLVNRADRQFRSTDYVLKKISPQKPIGKIPGSFFKTLIQTAKRYACPYGPLAHELSGDHLNTICVSHKPSRREPQDIDTIYFIGNLHERIEAYISHVQEVLQNGDNVLISAPSRIECERIGRVFRNAQYIQKDPIIIHGAYTTKQLQEKLTQTESTGGYLIIATPAYALISVEKTSLFIIEEVQSTYYYTRFREAFDYRYTLSTYAAHANIPLIRSGSYVSFDSKMDSHITYTPHTSSLKTSVVDMRTPDAVRKRKKNTKVQLLSAEAHALLRSHLKKNNHILIYVQRLGTFTRIYCKDCGTIVKDKSDTPMILAKDASEADRKLVFKSLHTDEVLPSDHTCQTCGSWNLIPIGIGIERVTHELENKFPDTHLIHVDKETHSTERAITKSIDEFEQTNSGILITTERALPYITHHVPLSIVVTIDSLLSLPEPSVRGQAIDILSHIQEITIENLLIQTRLLDHDVFSYYTDGVASLIETEKSERKLLAYPPYGTTLVIHGLRTYDPHTAQTITDMLEEYGSVLSISRGSTRILILQTGEEIPDSLRSLLIQLPRHIHILINPPVLFSDT